MHSVENIKYKYYSAFNIKKVFHCHNFYNLIRVLYCLHDPSVENRALLKQRSYNFCTNAALRLLTVQKKKRNQFLRCSVQAIILVLLNIGFSFHYLLPRSIKYYSHRLSSLIHGREKSALKLENFGMT